MSNTEFSKESFFQSFDLSNTQTKQTGSNLIRKEFVELTFQTDASRLRRPRRSTDRPAGKCLRPDTRLWKQRRSSAWATLTDQVYFKDSQSLSERLWRKWSQTWLDWRELSVLRWAWLLGLRSLSGRQLEEAPSPEQKQQQKSDYQVFKSYSHPKKQRPK